MVSKEHGAKLHGRRAAVRKAFLLRQELGGQSKGDRAAGSLRPTAMAER